ncbi:MAG: hypothetical protein ABR577_00120 [Pyrinomonadaceae bacterium]
MKRIFLPPFIIISFLLLFSNVVLGCGCVGMPEKPTPEQARAMLIKDFNGASAVFSGEVIALNTFKVKFKVDKLWKGDIGDEITMSTGAKDNGDGTYTSSSCDYHFKLGEKYMVYAYGASSKEVQAYACTRTRPLNYAEQETKDLDEVWPHVKKNQEPGNGDKVESLSPMRKSNNAMQPTLNSTAFMRETWP